MDATRPKPSLIPTAAEAGAITEVTVGALLPESRLTDIDQQRLAQYLTDAKAILLGILDQEAPDLAAFTLPTHEGLHLRHVRLLELAVQIAVTRARPFVDQGQAQLAADYIRAILDGAIAAVRTRIATKGRPRPAEITLQHRGATMSLISFLSTDGLR